MHLNFTFTPYHVFCQFNFYDHSKLILSSHGLLVTHIDKNYNLTRHKLSDVMAQSFNPSNSLDPEQVRFNQKLVDKLKYCKEVLVSIKEASVGVAAKQVRDQQAPAASERALLQPKLQERVQVLPIPKRSAGVEAATGGSGYTYRPTAQQQQGLVARASRMTLR